ncbi:MAG: FHA domain-containing protein, partial [Nitrospirae bacterium]|nr:FHA domain-containing protein [Nitrospirota bacterium]
MAMPFRMIKQIRRRGELESQTTNIPGDILTIGRGTDNSLHLEDLSVSFRHARIEYINGKYRLHDLTNG